MDHCFIADMREGLEVQQYFLLRQVEERLTRTGERYLAVILSDRTGILKGKVWANVLRDYPGPFRPGDYVGVVGQVSSFNGELQLTIQRIRTVAEITRQRGEAKGFDPALLHQAPAQDLDHMWEALLTLVRDKLTPPLQDLVLNLLEKNAAAWRQAPAARYNHHAYPGGLLEHTWQVTRLADAVVSLYPELHRELVLAGAILHDLGKLKEIIPSHAPDYTVPGQLLGHIVLGWEMVRQEAAALGSIPPALLLELEHIILSHHGYQEFGSPVLPKTREALLVYYLDDLDAKLKMMAQHLEADASERDFTPYHRLLQRELYKRSEAALTPAAEPEAEE